MVKMLITRNFHKRIDDKGFSLIEVAVVVAIVGILAAIAVPNMIGWRAEAKLSGAARNFYADLQLARMKAIRESEDISVTIDPSSNSYTVFFDLDSDGTQDSDEDTIVSKDMDSGVDIVSTTFSSDRTTFNSRGRPNIIGRVTFQNSLGTVIEVYVNRIGRIRVEG